ncbi:TrmH family RNA methyltransferase [Camelimonas abortus]|uniref:TrmH family RNA methyltransferase n=1 Tax=Camelimonas abortus TaxID=1017184 RepID=A0ABV7LGH0_9HYPH
MSSNRPPHHRRPPAAGPARPRPDHARREAARARAERNASRDACADDIVVLYGWRPVIEAIANPRRVFRRLLATENALRRLAAEGLQPPVAPETARPEQIERLVGPDAVHQGLYAEAEPLPGPTLESMPQHGVFLVLDQITDPHNVGAIVRTAAAFGVSAVITTARHSPAATGVLAKSASGGLEHVPLVTVRNLAGALQTMAERGVQCIGLDSAGPAPLEEIPMRRPLALVLGAEGKGLRQLTRARCQHLARLDMPGAIRSLNVSNAAAISLYAVSRLCPA